MTALTITPTESAALTLIGWTVLAMFFAAALGSTFGWWGRHVDARRPSTVDTLVDADEWLAASETPVFDQLAVEHLRAELDDQPAVDRWLR